MIKIPSDMPLAYDTTMELLMALLGGAGFTLVECRNYFNNKFKKLQKRKMEAEIEEKKAVLLMVTQTQNCRLCGKRGHEREECFKDPKNQAKYEE